ncbi:hypothetical protein I6A84_29715, partial [Frankia sp. CNm7]
MSTRHNVPGGTRGGRRAFSENARPRQSSTGDLGRAGAGRAVRGLMVSALVAAPIVVLTALPARADGTDDLFSEQSFDVQVDLGGIPRLDLDDFGQMVGDAVAGLLPAPAPPAPAPAAGTGGGVP